MTAVSPAAPHRSRIVNVVRMQLVSRMTFVWIPLLILAATFAMSLMIWAMIPSDGDKYSGAAQALLWYLFAVGIQSLTLTFPFSQAMSVTRREFFLGTMLTAALSAVLVAAVFVVGGLVELATDGWGMHGQMFYIAWMWSAGPGGAALAVFAAAMLTFTAGFWGATVYKRLGGIGLAATLTGLGLALLGTIWIVTRLHAWAGVLGWFGGLTVIGLSLVVLAVVAVLAASVAVLLRRLVP